MNFEIFLVVGTPTDGKLDEVTSNEVLYPEHEPYFALPDVRLESLDNDFA